MQITGGQADNGVAAQLSEVDGHFFILAESHHEGVPRGVFQRYRSDSHGQRLAEKRARRLDDSLRSCADSAPGGGAVSRISAVIADAASAIVTALDRSPAAIAWGREIGTTAATPAHLRSAVILWPTGCATGITGPYDKPLSNPLRGSGKEPRPDSEGQDAAKIYRLAADQSVDFGVFRKPAELFLGESEPAIDGDLENTGNPFD